MVFEYTDDERKQINNIDDQYAPKMAQLVKEQNNLDQDSDKYFEKEEEYYNLRKEYVRKVRNLQRKFEKSRFDQLGNDPEAILANGKEQTELIVQSLYTEAVKSDLVKDEKGNLVPRKGSKGLLYKDSTIELIKSELTLHFKALRGTPEGKELRNYIQTYIDNCPFILIETPPEEEGEEEAASAGTSITEVENLLSNDFLTMFNNNSINNFAKVTKRDFKEDEFTGEATALTSSGDKYTVKKYKNLIGDLSTSTNKILFTAISYLTHDNYTPKKGKSSLTNPTVQIPLKEYAEANGKKADQNFKNRIRNDLHDLREVEFSWEKLQGKNKGDFFDGEIISSYGITTNSNGISYITINFDISAAKSLIKSPETQFPVALIGHDNRNKNGFPIGYAIAVHNANYNNIVKGTNESLTVKSLLADAPDIMSYEELKAKGRRDWKKQIKEKLEDALDSNIEVGYLESWIYLNPKTQRTYTPEEAGNLTWNEYYNLCVDYRILHNNLQLEDYVQRKSAEKKALAEKKAEAKKTADS